MSQCQYIYTRGALRGTHCVNDAKGNTYCAVCMNRKVVRQQMSTTTQLPSAVSGVSQLPPVDFKPVQLLPVMSVAGVPEPSPPSSPGPTPPKIGDISWVFGIQTQIVGTFRQLCEKTPANEIIEEARRMSFNGAPEDISLDIALAAKYLVSAEPDSRVDNCDAIVIPAPYIIQWIQDCNYTLFNTKLEDNYLAIMDFLVDRNVNISDAHVVALIIWTITKTRWPKGLPEWVTAGKTPASQEEYNQIGRAKLGLN